MTRNPNIIVINTTVDKLGFNNPNNVGRLQEYTEKAQKVTVLAHDIHAIAVLKHLDNGGHLDTETFMSRSFITQCFLVCAKNGFSDTSQVDQTIQDMRKIVEDVWNEYSERLHLEKIDLPCAGNFAPYFQKCRKTAIISNIKNQYFKSLMDTVRRICRFDDDEQPGDRNAKQKALLEFVCTVLPKDVVDTGVEAGLHPDLITVLSTYSSGFVRSDDMLDDSINNKPKDHLWAMLKLNEVRCRHNLSITRVLPFSDGPSPTFIEFDAHTIYNVVISASERFSIDQEHAWDNLTNEEQSRLPHACKDCNMRFKKKRYLALHRKVAHYTEQEFPLKCAKCGMPFHKSSKLAKHNPDTCDSRRWY